MSTFSWPSNASFTVISPIPLPITTTQLPATLGAHVISGSLAVNIASDQIVPVSLSSVPLPTGAATSALQITGNTTLSAISGQLPATLGAHLTAASLAVNIASDQIVPVSLSSVPLPTGAATSANQTNGNQKTQIVDGSGSVIASTSNALNNFITNTSIAITAASLPLPSGASTSALQTQISGQLPATLGAHLTSASLAVNIASDQTVPVSAAQLPATLGAHVTAASLAVNIASDQTVPVSISSVPLPSGAATSANQTNGSQKSQIVDGSGNVIAATSNALNSFVTNFPATQPVSGTVTANQGTANATPWNDNIAQFGGTSVTLGSKVSASSMPVVIASDQAAVPVSQSGSWSVTANAGTNLNTSALSTSANQTNGSQKTQLATPTAGTITQAAITVGTSAVRLTVSGSAPSSSRSVLVVTPDSASTATFYVGSSSVVNSGASRGFQLSAGQTFTANNDAGDYYIIASATSQTVYVMEQA